VAKKKRLTTILENAAGDPAVRAVAASTALAGGALAGKLVHARVERAHTERERRYRLGRSEAAGDGIKRVVAGQLDQALDFLRAEGAGKSVQAVHDARKALKRGRAALRVARHLLGGKRYRVENTALRDAGRGLSDIRDAHVLVETLEEVAPPGKFERLRDRLAAQAAAGENNGRELDGVLPELERARSRVSSWTLSSDGGPEQLGPGLERIYRRGRRALRAARDEPSVDNLHKLRKRAKDLSHTAQLLQEWRPKRAAKLARRAHDLSDLLGLEHDLAILGERLDGDPTLVDPSERQLLKTLIKRRRAHLRREALRRAKRLYRRKPRKLRQRLALN
jgi:CHAD domain-containing protein